MEEASPEPLDPECALPGALLELFLRTAPKQLQDLLDSCEGRDQQRASALAHNLKGTLYAAGALRLAEKLEVLRTLIGQGHWSTVPLQLPAIRRGFASVIEQLQQRLREGRG